MRLLFILALAVFAHAAEAARKPLVGISANVKEGGTMADVVREIKELRKDGCGLMYVSHKWSELEPKPGQFDLHDIDGLRYLSSLGYRIALTIQTIDTNNRTLPPDLQDKPFDSPEMWERFAALLRAIAPKLDASVDSVMLGNEVDIYLAQHPAELEPFATFVEQGRDLLRALRQGQRVGVTTTFDGLNSRFRVFQRVNRKMDVITLTYYPLKPDFSVRPVSDVAGDFDRMARAAGSKPLLLQEVGYPADPLLGSSDEKQAGFIDAVFDAMRRHADRIEFANFFLLYDFDSKMVDGFLKYYRVPDPKFRAYLATLGLKRADGTPRAAWSRFLARTRAWSQGPR